ncbi:hypothetical protein KIN20_008138 [Parelaphostrongylus tenuis]|uniref:Uncharacterized protein n=1 Tax=Parelaphostrongylus tenuis TaxID=148309 RepID=A0AAD5QMH4_PARTN|nr:hypothetical protein KIN20_008138 [Parelaphostrongylus tenuis]
MSDVLILSKNNSVIPGDIGYNSKKLPAQVTIENIGVIRTPHKDDDALDKPTCFALYTNIIGDEYHLWIFCSAMKRGIQTSQQP